MARTILSLAIALVLLSSSGCCWIRRVLCDECCSPCDTGAFTYYAGKSCGEAYRGDWHSHPPKCEPCDQCGNYVGCSECDGRRQFCIHPLRSIAAFLRCGCACDGY